MTNNYDRRESALLIALSLAVTAICGAWFAQLVLELLPCKLCLQQRWPYYLGIPVIVAAMLLIRVPGRENVARALAALAVLVFLWSVGGGLYHAGVEWKFWAGPSDCGGQMFSSPASVEDFRKLAEYTRVLRCDQAGGRVLGLSFAGWNALVSMLVVVFAARATSARA